MESSALSDIIKEVEDSCWRCGSARLSPSFQPIVGAIVVCDNCGHEHYFTKEIPDVPHHT